MAEPLQIDANESQQIDICSDAQPSTSGVSNTLQMGTPTQATIISSEKEKIFKYQVQLKIYKIDTKKKCLVCLENMIQSQFIKKIKLQKNAPKHKNLKSLECLL